MRENEDDKGTSEKFTTGDWRALVTGISSSSTKISTVLLAEIPRGKHSVAPLFPHKDPRTGSPLVTRAT